MLEMELSLNILQLFFLSILCQSSNATLFYFANISVPKCTYPKPMVRLNTQLIQLVKVQKYFRKISFPIDSNAFSCSQEVLYRVILRCDNMYFVIVVQLDNRGTHYLI